MSEEQAPYDPGPPALDDTESPTVTLSRHRYRVLLQAEKAIEKLGIRDVYDDVEVHGAAERTLPGMAMLQLLIGKDTVEPEGILARIERHLVRAFGMIDELTAGQDANTAGLKDINDRLSHIEAQFTNPVDVLARTERLVQQQASRLEKIDKSIRDAHDDITVRLCQQTNAFVERFVRLERDMKDVRDVLSVHVEQRLSNIERAIVAMIARS